MSKSAFASKVVDIDDQDNRLTQKQFVYLRDLLQRESGIFLTEAKITMIESRLGKRLRNLGISRFDEYIPLLESDSEELHAFINALTTNKTEFFREVDHFDYLTKTLLPKMTEKNKTGMLTAWSAAASTGQEALTLAMTFSEYFSNHSGYDYRIVGTDINDIVLEKARQGIYSAELLGPVRADLIQKYFLRRGSGRAAEYQAKSEITSRIKFRQLNLVTEDFSVDIRFDVIFLRNILIYFEPETIELIVRKMHKRLNPGGSLFLGHSETLNGIKHEFEQLPSAIYRKKA